MNARQLFLRHVAQTSDNPLSGVEIDVVKAEGCWLTDRSGKKYLDLISGISVSTVGHCHPDVVKAVQEQCEKYMHLLVYGELNQEPQRNYAQSLSGFTGELDTVFFTTGGSEAIEGAIKLAKRFTGRPEIISFANAYHGSTQGALSIMGHEQFKSSFRPLIPGGRILEYNNTQALQQITSETAAVVVECVQGEAGVISAAPGFLQALRKRCDITGSLLIADEIQTGFGRCGTMFSYEEHNISPDILVLAKAMGGGMPCGAFVARNSLMSSLTTDPVLGHINTFGGNAVCVAAAQACLNVLTRDKLWEKAQIIEKTILGGLRHPLIREVRCKGALGAIDFGDENVNMRVIRSCLEKGLVTDWFLFCPTAMRIAPPLIISMAELENALSSIKAVLDDIRAEQ